MARTSRICIAPRDPNAKPRVVNAEIFGPLAVHDGDTITHVKTGRRVVCQPDRPALLAQHLANTVDWEPFDRLAFGEKAAPELRPAVQAALDAYSGVAAG